MTIGDLGALGEFLGLFAVLATLIYLSIQTKQAKEIAIAQAIQTVHTEFRQVWKTLGEDADKARVIRIAVNNWKALTRNEQMIAHTFFILLITHFDGALQQVKRLPEVSSAVLGWEDNILGLVQSNGGREWYDGCNYLFNDIVLDRIEERLSQSESLPPAWNEGMTWWKTEESEFSEQST